MTADEPRMVAALRRQLDREIRARKEAEEIAESHLGSLYDAQRRLDVLGRVSAIAAETDEAERGIRLALPLLMEFADMTFGHFWVASAATDGFEASDVWFGPTGPELDRLRASSADLQVVQGQGMVGQALTGTPVWVADVAKSAEFLRTDGLPTGSAIAFAVLAADAVVAVVEMLDPRPRPQDEDVVDVCSVAGLALGRVAVRQQAAQQVASRNRALEAEVARHNESLSLARRRADTSTRAAEAFFTALSHDLKTPLHTILAIIEGGQEESTGLPADKLDVIRNETLEMLARVDRLLNLSPHADSDLGPHKVVLASALTPALSTYREVLAAQGQRLSVRLAEELNEPVVTDSGKMLQILDSVMARVVPSRGNHVVGIEAHLAEGELVVVVSLPTGVLALEDTSKLTAEQDDASIAVVSDSRETRIEIRTVAREIRANRKSDVHRVLVVDDNEVTQRLGAKMISSMGYEVMTASSGNEAIAALRAQPFGLVLMDIRMPGRDGHSTTRGIRDGEAGERARETAIVALTANTAPGDAEQSALAGMDAHVTKPVTRARLSQVVADYIGSAT